MALAASEQVADGLVRDKTSGALVITTNTAGAISRDGVLCDPDGRLVVSYS